MAKEAWNEEKNRKEGISKHIKTENLYILNNGKAKKMDKSTSILFSQTVPKEMDSMSKAYHEKKTMQIDHRKIKLTFF